MTKDNETCYKNELNTQTGGKEIIQTPWKVTTFKQTKIELSGWKLQKNDQNFPMEGNPMQ